VKFYLIQFYINIFYTSNVLAYTPFTSPQISLYAVSYTACDSYRHPCLASVKCLINLEVRNEHFTYAQLVVRFHA